MRRFNLRKLRCGVSLVGAAGFEPATSRSQTVRSTKLSHAPIFLNISKIFRLTLPS